MLFDIIGLVGSVASGGGLSLITHGLDMFSKSRERKADNAHEIKLMELEMDAREKGFEADERASEFESRAQVQQALAQADVDMHRAATDSDSNETNQSSQWVINYKSTTRPNILYGLFAANVLLLIWGMISPEGFAKFVGAVPIDEGQGSAIVQNAGAQIVLGIRTGFLVGLGFYFGDRGIGKMRGQA